MDEEEYRVMSEAWFGVMERFRRVFPHRFMDKTYFRNKVFFICDRTLYKIFIDRHVALCPETEERRDWVHGELESLYGFNFFVDPEAPEGGYFVDDRGTRLDESDVQHWRELLRRWKEEEKKECRNLRQRGERFYGKIAGRIEDLKRQTGQQDLASHFLLLNRADRNLLKEGGPLVKEIFYGKRYHLVRTDPEETLGIEIMMHPACRKGGMIIERVIADAPKPR